MEFQIKMKALKRQLNDDDVIYKVSIRPQRKMARLTDESEISCNRIEPTSEFTTSFPNLPDDAMIDIINMVPVAQWSSLEFVSRQFQRVVYAAWRDLREININDELSVRDPGMEGSTCIVNWMLRKMIIRAPFLKSISGFCELFHRHSLDFEETTALLLAQFAYLERISFSNIHIGGKDLAYFLEKSYSRDRLKEINLTDCHIVSNEGGEQAQRDSQRLCQAFGAIPIIDRDETVEAVPQFLEPELKLEKFSFVSSTCLNFSFNFFDNIDTSIMTTLNLAQTTMAPDRLASLILCCRIHLRHLDFSFYDCDHQCNGHLEANRDILRAIGLCDNLATLKISRRESIALRARICWNIHGELESLIRQFGQARQLTELSIMEPYLCINLIVSAIATHMSHLTSLGLHLFKNCTTASLKFLAINLRQLEELRLFGPTDFLAPAASQPSISPLVISTIAANLVHLKRLSLHSVFSQSNVFKSLSQLKFLKELSIAGKGVVRNPQIMAWKKGFVSQLEILNLPLSRFATDTGVTTLIKMAPRLRQLSLDATRMTDESLIAISASCPRLRELQLSSCKNLTLVGLQAIIDGCLQLKVLQLRGEGIPGRFPSYLAVGKYRKIKFIRLE